MPARLEGKDRGMAGKGRQRRRETPQTRAGLQAGKGQNGSRAHRGRQPGIGSNRCHASGEVAPARPMFLAVTCRFPEYRNGYARLHVENNRHNRLLRPAIRLTASRAPPVAFFLRPQKRNDSAPFPAHPRNRRDSCLTSLMPRDYPVTHGRRMRASNRADLDTMPERDGASMCNTSRVRSEYAFSFRNAVAFASAVACSEAVSA